MNEEIIAILLDTTKTPRQKAVLLRAIVDRERIRFMGQ